MHKEYGKDEELADVSCTCVGVVSIICSLIAVIMPKTDVTADQIITFSVKISIDTTGNIKERANCQ